MKFVQNVVSKRFVEAFQSLKEMRAFATQLEAAEKLDFSPNTLSEILKGKRDVTIELLRKFFITYKIRPSFIFDSDLLRKEELKSYKEPFNETQEFKAVESNIKKINFLYQRIVDMFVIGSALNSGFDHSEIDAFAEQRNKVIDNEAYKKMSVEKLIEYNKELEDIIKSFEDFFFSKHRDLFYKVVAERQIPNIKAPIKKPSNKKK